MKREDAIWILELIRNRDARTDAEKDAVNAAIEALKAQLSCEGIIEGTTFDLISRTETVERLRITLGATVPIADYDDGYVDGVQFAINTVSTMSAIQPEPAIPVAWIENEIKWLKSLDNTFSEITALQISVMVKKWKDEQNETD